MAGRRPLGRRGSVFAFSQPVTLDGTADQRDDNAEHQPDQWFSEDDPVPDEPDQDKRQGADEPYLPVIYGIPPEESLEQAKESALVIRAGHAATEQRAILTTVACFARIRPPAATARQGPAMIKNRSDQRILGNLEPSTCLFAGCQLVTECASSG